MSKWVTEKYKKLHTKGKKCKASDFTRLLISGIHLKLRNSEHIKQMFTWEAVLDITGVHAILEKKNELMVKKGDVTMQLKELSEIVLLKTYNLSFIMLQYQRKIRWIFMTAQSYVLVCGPLLFQHLKPLQSRAWSDREGLPQASRLTRLYHVCFCRWTLPF